MTRWLLAAVLIGLAGIAQAQGLGAVEAFLRRGQYRLAAQNITRQLEKSPDDIELSAMLGVAWSKMGFSVDALVMFQLCPGASYYEARGLDAHADALRALGRGEAAASLRIQRLLTSDLSEVQQLLILLWAADDLRAAGDYRGALEQVYRAEALFPRSPMVSAVLADIWMDAGDLEQADAALWANTLHGQTSRGASVRARRAMLDEDFAEASEILEAARMFRNPTPRLASLRAEVLRLQGDPHAAADILERNRWRSMEIPELITARLRVYADLEDAASAENWVALAEQHYGANLEVTAALMYFKEHQ